MARRSRGDSRLDGIALAVALILSIVARALPEPRADRLAGALRGSVLAPLTSLQERAERARAALDRHDSVMIVIDSLVLRAVDVERLASDNARLRALLELGAHTEWGFVAAEAMHPLPLGEPHTIVLNIGTDAGVTRFSAVIAPEGIVGYVRSATATSSVAIVWPHPDFRVSAVVAGSPAAGIVSAHLGEGPSRYLLELRGVPYRTPLDTGTRVVSSGMGGVFPRGVPIGTVIRELTTAEGWARNYLVLPAVRAVDVGSVLVLLPPRSRTDMSAVWGDSASAAAAVARAVAAGDSILSARRDSIARVRADSLARILRDSIRRDSIRRDSVRRDSIRRDTIRRDTVRRATFGGGQ